MTPGFAAYDRGDLQAAVRILEPFGEAGNMVAERFLGQIFIQGLDGTPDLSTARMWLRKAALQGDLQSQYNLAASIIDEKGENGPLIDEAKSWLEKAATGGLGAAQTLLGEILVRQSESYSLDSLESAYRWLRLAASSGYKPAVSSLEAIAKNLSKAAVAELDQRVQRSLLSYVRTNRSSGCQHEEDRTFDELCFIHNEMAGRLAMQDKLEYREKPGMSLGDLADLRLKGLRLLPGATVFTLFSEGYATKDRRILHAPPSVLLSLTRPGDQIFLSDRVTNHLMMTFSVDAEAKTISLIDYWPEKVFLLKDANTLGIEAKIVPYQGDKKLVVITDQEFLRVCRGMIIVSSPRFADFYFCTAPNKRSDISDQLALGLSILEMTDPHVYPQLAKDDDGSVYAYAASHFLAAAHSAEEAKRVRERDFALSRLHLCLRFQKYFGSTEARATAQLL